MLLFRMFASMHPATLPTRDLGLTWRLVQPSGQWCRIIKILETRRAIALEVIHVA